MNNLIREMANAPRGKLRLGDREFPLFELNWNDYIAMEDEFGRDPDEWRGMRAARYLLWLGLRKSDPSLTLEQVGELVTATSFEQVADAIDTILGGDSKNM